MAGSVVVIDTIAAIAADTTKTLTGARGSHRAATFFFDCTAIGAGDTWQVSLRWKTDAGTNSVLALSATFTSTGLKELVNQSPYTLDNRAVPAPGEVFYDNSVNGGAIALSGSVYAMYGD